MVDVVCSVISVLVFTDVI